MSGWQNALCHYAGLVFWCLNLVRVKNMTSGNWHSRLADKHESKRRDRRPNLTLSCNQREKQCFCETVVGNHSVKTFWTFQQSICPILRQSQSFQLKVLVLFFHSSTLKIHRLFDALFIVQVQFIYQNKPGFQSQEKAIQWKISQPITWVRPKHFYWQHYERYARKS